MGFWYLCFFPGFSEFFLVSSSFCFLWFSFVFPCWFRVCVLFRASQYSSFFLCEGPNSLVSFSFVSTYCWLPNKQTTSWWAPPKSPLGRSGGGSQGQVVARDQELPGPAGTRESPRRDVVALMRNQPEQAWRLRWGSIFSCLVVRAATSMPELPGVRADGSIPSAADVELDFRHANWVRRGAQFWDFALTVDTSFFPRKKILPKTSWSSCAAGPSVTTVWRISVLLPHVLPTLQLFLSFLQLLQCLPSLPLLVCWCFHCLLLQIVLLTLQ